MHGFVSSMVAGVLVSGAVWVPPASPAFASMSMSTSAAELAEPSGEPDPAELYDQGRKAYRLGDFETAVQKWERAYELSDRPLLLYNISLAYKGLHGITKDVADLRRARAVLDNFIKLAEADPELEADDAPERLAELDAMIAEVERKASASTQGTGNVAHVEPKAEPGSNAPGRAGGPDPGRVFKHAGIGLMASGGVLVITGVALGSYFSVRGADFQRDLQDTYRRANDHGCDPNAHVQVGACEDIVANIEIYRDNGRKANRSAYVSFGLGAGLGVAALATGVAMFVIGKRRTQTWERGLGRHALNVTWTRRGVSLAGRF